jgi:hypothetical protein
MIVLLQLCVPADCTCTCGVNEDEHGHRHEPDLKRINCEQNRGMCARRIASLECTAYVYR